MLNRTGLLSTSVVSASPSTSSAMITSGLCCALASSSAGISDWAAEILRSLNSIRASWNSHFAPVYKQTDNNLGQVVHITSACPGTHTLLLYTSRQTTTLGKLFTPMCPGTHTWLPYIHRQQPWASCSHPLVSDYSNQQQPWASCSHSCDWLHVANVPAAWDWQHRFILLELFHCHWRLDSTMWQCHSLATVVDNSPSLPHGQLLSPYFTYLQISPGIRKCSHVKGVAFGARSLEVKELTAIRQWYY